MRLTGGTSDSTDGLVIRLVLTVEDFNKLKRNTLIFSSLDTSYLVVDPSFIKDMAGNPIKAIIDGDALRATEYQNDTIMPVLTGFSLDMDNGNLTLTFSETVNVQSLDLTQLTLQRTANVINNTFSLTGGDLWSVINDTRIYIRISDDDLNQLKTRTIADSNTSAYLTFPSTALLDMNQQPVRAQVNGLSAFPVSDYTADTTSPLMVSYTLNLTSGVIDILFSETVNVRTSLDVTQLTLQDTEVRVTDTPGLRYFTLGSTSVSRSLNTPTLSIELSLEDLNAIKRRETLATAVSNTYIAITSSFIRDMVGNEIRMIPSSEGLQALAVYEDTIRPQLNSYSLDLTAEVLILSLSETVNIQTIDLTSFTFHSSSTDQRDSYTLTSGIIVSSHSHLITVNLSTADLNIIKEMFTLAVSEDTTYLSVTETALQDMNGLSIVPTNSQQVANYTEDLVQPQLVSFDLDLDSGAGLLTLSFTETVNTDTLQVSNITFHNALTMYSLDTSYTLSSNGTVVVITLSEEDSNTIKYHTDLATNAGNAQLSITEDTISDMNDNPVVAIENTASEGVSVTFTADTTVPKLRSFSLNLTSEILTLTFSETMSAVSIDPTGITLLSGNSTSQNFTLTGGSPSTINSPVIEIKLSFADLNTLKTLTMLATALDSTYISITSSLGTDMNNNPVLPIGTDNVLKASDFSADEIKPRLENLRIDLHTGRIILTFSETVNISSLNISELILVDCCRYSISNDTSGSGDDIFGSGSTGNASGSASGLASGSTPMEILTPLYQFRLRNGLCVSTSKTVFTCTLDVEDLNEIKRLPFCTEQSDCCMIFTGDAIRDHTRNEIETEFGNCGVNSTYTKDMNRPLLLEFTAFNLNLSTLTLTFNETIRVSTINMTAITLQSFYYNAHYSYTLTGGNVLSQDSTIAELGLLQSDLFAIQRLRALCSEINNCWISFTDDFVQDMAGNRVIPVPNTNAKPAVTYIDDFKMPRLLSFTLDLSNDTLVLTFSEIVDAESLTPTAISILSNRSDTALNIPMTGGSTVSPDGLIITVQLLSTDTNRLRASDNIATRENNTFISITSDLITDAVRLEPNPVEAIGASSALQILSDGLYMDSIAPNLTKFTLDLDRDIITLTFDEPVRVSSILYDHITLISDPSNSPIDRRVLTGGVIDTQTNFNGTMSLIVHLTQSDIRYLKLSEVYLATDEIDTFISVIRGMILDMAGNPLEPIPFIDALMVDQFTPDSTPAMLIDFQLDMNLGLLHLTFNDIINSSTLYAPAITIQDSKYIMTNYVTLTRASTTASPNGYYITVDISTADLNRIKLDDNLATDISNTFLSMRAEAFMDNFEVDVIAVTSHDALPASAFTNDSTSPRLVNFSLDMNRGIVHLTFDETVRANTIVEEEIILLGGTNISLTSSVQLTSGMASVADSTLIDVYIVADDLNEVKFLTDLGTSVANTFIAFSEDLIMDMNQNPVTPVDQFDAKQAREVFEDRTSPMLLSFSVNLTDNTLTLTFDETVNGATLIANGLTVQSSSVLMMNGYRRLMSSSGSVNNSTVTTVFLGLSDLNEIKRLTSLATSVNNSYLSALSFTIQDMNGNQLSNISSSNAHPANAFYPDTIRPYLEGFSLNLSSEILTLSFSETVRASTHYVSLYTLLSSTDDDSVQYRLTGALAISDDYHVLDVELTTADLNAIKRLIDLATDETSTYLLVDTGAIEDMFGNPLYSLEEPLNVTDFTADLVPPQLNSFNIDLNTGEMTLFFSETINTSSLQVDQIRLQNSDNASQYFWFTDSSYINDTFYHIITVYISTDDLNEIKRLNMLAVDNSTTYLSITSEFVSDMNDNAIIAISTTNSLPVSVYTQDTNPPEVVAFDLNMNSSLLILQFNETVQSATLDVSAITIQNNETSSQYSLTLTNSSYSMSPDGTTIVINIGISDLNELKRLDQLATSLFDTYLSLSSNAIRDMADNSVVPVLPSSALLVSEFTPDQIDPVLDEFSLDMNTACLRLTFSETVNALTLNISNITLQSRASANSDSYTLTEGLLPELSYSNSTDSTILKVYIGLQDLNEIKRIYTLATTPNNTFLVVSSDTVEDMNGLSVTPILSTDALQVASYTADTSLPQLLFASLNLTSEFLSLTFDETVNVESFNVTQVTIQSAYNVSEGTYVDLNHLTSLSAENSTVVSFRLSFDDLNDIKLNTELATNPENTWIRLFPSAILDMAHDSNPNDDTIQRVFTFTSDDTQPRITSFSVNLNAGHLILNFDEPVDVSTLNFTAFTLYSIPSSPITDFNNASLHSNDTLFAINSSDSSGSGEIPLTYYTLTDGFTNSSNGLQIILVFTTDDLNAIKKDEFLYTSRHTSYLSITSYAIRDMNVNPIASIVPSNAIRAFQYISDETSPVLVSFDLDMNTGLLVLHFPETIDVSTTKFDGIVLQQSPNVTLSIRQYMLTSGYLNMTSDGVSAYIQITHDDLNEIKQRRIALSNATAWLTIEESTLLDMSRQPLLPLINGHSAQRVNEYTSDYTSPRLVSYILDLNANTLFMSFSETVDGYNLNISAITLQDTANASHLYNHYSLRSSNSYVSSAYGPNVTVTVGLYDMNIIKQIVELAVSQDSTYMSITEDLVADVFGNDVIAIPFTEAKATAELVPDMTSPNLTSFELDMDSKILTLYFSETVNGSSLNITAFTLWQDRTTDDAPLDTYTLQTSNTSTLYDSTVTVQISDSDFNRIKQLLNLATNINNTYLSLTSDAILDTSNNPVTAVSSDEALRASDYIQDATNPTLTGFDLNMNDLTLTLTFSETVNISSIDYTALTLQDTDAEQSTQYTLISGRTYSPNGPVVVLQITKEDEDNIKRIPGLATTANDTYLSITSLLILDMDDLPVVNITTDMALAVTNFTEDSTRPTLLSFSLNLTSDVLTLTFSETVNVSTLDIGSILLQNEMTLDNETAYHFLTDSTFVMYNDPIVQIMLSFYDRNEIRRLYILATDDCISADRCDTYLSIASGAVTDMVDLPLVAILNTTAKPVAIFTSDSTPPYLLSFSLNMSSEILTLNFSETMNISTFDAGQLTLVGIGNDSIYQLTGGVVIDRDHTHSIDILLSDPDLNAIKFDTKLATTLDSTQLTFTSALVTDMNHNPVIPIISPVVAVAFSSDTIDPVLTNFDFDLNEGTLSLYFSETVNAQSLDTTQITLLPYFNASDNTSFIFSDSSMTYSINGTVIIVNISLNDLNDIKRLSMLAVDNTTTYLALTNRAIADMNNNRIEPVTKANPSSVQLYNRDITKPELESFSVNFTSETITLFFSETINSSSFDVTAITIQDNQSNATQAVTLSSGRVITDTNEPIITISLTQNDLNRIKSITELATDIDDTFLSATSNLVFDMSGNELSAISASEALQASTVYEDTISPELVSFDLDMNSGTITLYFSESVSSTSLIAQSLTFQNTQESNTDTVKYTLINDSADPIIVLNNSVQLIFTLSDTDRYGIQELVLLATSPNDTYLSFGSDFIVDQFNNSIIEKIISALPVSKYTRDTTCPHLVGSSFDLNAGVLVLTFSEPVNASTFDERQLTVYDSASLKSTSSHTLTSVKISGEDVYSRFMILELSNYDTDTIKSITTLGSSLLNTFVYLSSESVKDTSDNDYCNDTLPLQINDFIGDDTSPQLLNYTLDLDLATIYLTFSESVQYMSFNFTEITLLSAPNSTIEYTLTDGMTAVNTTTPHIVILTLTPDDTNEIKHLTSLASYIGDTYIALTEYAVQDYSDNDVEMIDREEAKPAQSYLPDKTPPRLLEFDLDMNTGVLALSFSEVINISSVTVQELTIQNQQSLSPDAFYVIQNANLTFETLTRLLVELSTEDLNAIKRMPTLATNDTNTYLSFTSNMVSDNAGLQVVSIGPDNAEPVMMYTVDRTSPQIITFSLNLTSEVLTLTFDETVDASSVNVLGFTIQSDLNETLAERVSLTNGIVSTDDSTLIHIQLADLDLHNIKRQLELATNENNTCLSVASGSVTDMSEEMNTIFSTTLCSKSFTEDKVRPNLISFGANVNRSELYLNFDEPINLASINLTYITVQSVKNTSSTGAYESYTLTGGNVSSTSLLQFTVTMTNDDLNEIKRLLSLLRGPFSSYLSITEEFAVDLNNNPVVPIPTNDALDTSMFFDDVNRPSLESYDLDMNTGLLTLSFSETVAIATFDITGISLQIDSSVSLPEHQYTLTSGTLLNTDNGPVVSYVISNDDLNILKTRGIARYNTQTYLAMTNYTISDIIGQSVVPLINGVHVLMVTGYSPDTNPPLLSNFTLNMDTGILTLFFNESVDTSTLNVDQLTLTSRVNETSDLYSFTLTPKSTSGSLDIPVIQISLHNDDLNEIKKRPGLATSINNSYIFMSSESIVDMFNNKNVELTPLQAIRASQYIEDNTRPVLNGFELDMNTGVLTLSFTETVNTSSLNTAGITLYNDVVASQSYTLSGNYVTVNGFAPVVEIQLTNDDLNQIKVREMLATSKNDTYIGIDSIALTDMNSNDVVTSSIIPAIGYTIDTTPPVLEYFVMDMNLGQMVLNFSESVRYESVLFDYLAVRANETLPSIPANVDRQHQFTNGTVLTLSGPSLRLQVHETDLNEIKRKDVCTIDLKEQDCYLAYRTGGLTDMAGNPIQGCREL